MSEFAVDMPDVYSDGVYSELPAIDSVDGLDDITTYVSGSGYPGAISSQYVDMFAGIVRKRWGHDYLLFRQDQWRYTLLYDGDLSLSDTSLMGTAKTATYYTGSGGQTASFSFGDEQTVNLNLSGLVVYSNLGDYPVLGGVTREVCALPWLMLVFGLVAVVASFLRR